MENKERPEPKKRGFSQLDPLDIRKIRALNELGDLDKRPSDEQIDILRLIAEMEIENEAWIKLNREEREQRKVGNRVKRMKDELSGADAERFRKASGEVMADRGIERRPEVGLLSSGVVKENVEFSSEETLPDSTEERYAYILYRKGGLKPEIAFLFATKGFIYNAPDSPYIPVDEAVRIADIAVEMIEKSDTVEDDIGYSLTIEFSPEDALEFFLDENDFGEEDIDAETQRLIRSIDLSLDSLRHLERYDTFKLLPEHIKKEILKDYIRLGKNILQEEINFRVRRILHKEWDEKTEELLVGKKDEERDDEE